MLCLSTLSGYAQNAGETNFHPLQVWNGESRQKPLRQFIPLTGRWMISTGPGAAEFAVTLPALFPTDRDFSCSRDFFLSAELADRPLRLVLGPIGYRCQVLLNDHLVGNHEGSSSAFALEVNPEHLLPGQTNKLRLEIDTRLQPLTTIPARLRPQAGKYTPGIFENIFFEALPDFAIDSVRCLTRLDEQNAAATLQIKTTLRIRDKLPAPPVAPAVTNAKSKAPAPDQISLVAELFDSTGVARIAGTAPIVVENFDDLQQEFTMELRLDQPQLWAPGQPHLYLLRVAVARGVDPVDEWREMIGVRSLQWEQHRLLVNGQPITVRGIEWAGPGLGVSPYADSAACSAIVDRVVEWGGNLLRVVGQPAPPALLEACDRRGILVLEEIPIYHFTASHLVKNRFTDIARALLGEMIARDRNHPSVVGWGMAVRSAAPVPQQQVFERLRTFAAMIDDRPVYAVTDPAGAKSWTALADFLIIDSFEKDLTPIIPALKGLDKPILTRFGFSLTPAPAGATTGQPVDITTQQRQANKIKNALDDFTANKDLLAGYVVAGLQDWRVDAPLMRAGFRGTPDVYPAGLLSFEGERRLAFQVMQAAHREVRGPALPPENYKVDHPDVYAGVGIGLIAVVLFFVNRDKRLLANLRRAFAHPHGFYFDIVENRKVSPALTILLALAEGCVFAILCAGFLFAYRNSPTLDNLLMMLTQTAEAKGKLVWLVWHPAWLIVAGTVAYVVAGFALIGLLRIVAFIFGRRATVFQLFTMVFWAAANVLLLGVIAPLFYGLLASGRFVQPLLFSILFVAVWFLLRVFRGMRVVFGVNYFKTLILFAIVFGGIGLSIYLYYDRTQALWDYTRHYWTMLAGR